MSKKSNTRTLVEGAMLIALATVLSYLKIFEMPMGGSITLEMLPLVIMALRNGPKWGCFTGFVHGLLQMIIGFSNVLYCATLLAQIGCILLDYLLAFTVLGLTGVIAKPFRSRLAGIGVSAFAVCLLRYLCSFLSGYIVWKDYDYAFSWMSEIGFGGIASMSENALCWLYSAVYNATYMVPEAVITTIAAVVLCKAAPKLFEQG